jgi:uncharacterized protein YfiM (DUF2279 family)
VLCTVPSPAPLGAPDWSVSVVSALTGLGENASRAGASLVLRVGGLALLGALLLFASGAKRWERRSIDAILLAPVIAIGTLWVNLGYFPIGIQWRLGALSAAFGALGALALARNKVAALSFALALAALFAWGTATGISDEEDAATRAVARHVLAVAPQIPDGDAGFTRLLEVAFEFAADNDHGDDPVQMNRAAVLALAVIAGEEKVATVARRSIDASKLPEVQALRERISVHGRKDWVQHFFVSAGLTLLSDADRSIGVGLTKELLDAQPGGSGFSFSDLTADAAGNRFANAATRDAEAARAMQARMRAGAAATDFLPDVRDLPENLSVEEFQERFGGLGGAGTQEVVADVRRRLEECAGLRVE